MAGIEETQQCFWLNCCLELFSSSACNMWCMRRGSPLKIVTNTLSQWEKPRLVGLLSLSIPKCLTHCPTAHWHRTVSCPTIKNNISTDYWLWTCWDRQQGSTYQKMAHIEKKRPISKNGDRAAALISNFEKPRQEWDYKAQCMVATMPLGIGRKDGINWYRAKSILAPVMFGEVLLKAQVFLRIHFFLIWSLIILRLGWQYTCCHWWESWCLMAWDYHFIAKSYPLSRLYLNSLFPLNFSTW